MANYNINTYEDPKSLYRAQTIKIGSKQFQTPIKSIELSQVDGTVQLNKQIYGLNEIHKKLYETTQIDKNGNTLAHSIDDLLSSPEKFGFFNTSLNIMRRRGRDGDINVCFVEYDGKKYPAKESIELMARVAHEYSDVVPIPIVGGLKKRFENPNEISKYLAYLERTYNEINARNNKPIMGIIPALTPRFIDRIVDFYLKKDLRFFYFDFNAAYPESVSLLIKQLLIRFHKEEILDQCFIHGLNANMGKISQKKDIIPAKDIMAFGYGFNGLGRYMGPHFFSSGDKSQKQKELEKNRLRLFRKEDYGCHKITKTKDLENIYPEDSSVPIDALVKSLQDEIDYKSQRLFNLEQQGMEAHNLRLKIVNQEAIKYVEEKTQVDKVEVKKMELLHKEIKEQTFL